ncbi:MAG: helix-turn-helix domain-containing protein, partial [Mucilaginibacter sp.]
MQNQKPLTLVTPKTGNLAFKIFSFDDNSHFDHVQRNNYYNIVIILSGSGKVKADFSTYDFAGPTLMSFSLYQPYMFSPDSELTGIC